MSKPFRTRARPRPRGADIPSRSAGTPDRERRLAAAREWAARARARLARRGFNLTGIVDARRFDGTAPPGQRLRDLLPEARSALVIAAGGRALWKALTRAHSPGAANRSAARSDPDPIDRFTESVVSAEVSRFGAAFPRARLRPLYPFGNEAAPVSFIRLAEEVGLGTADTVLRLLLHPEYGPWVSLRACLLSDVDFLPTGRLEAFRPCEGCARPCLEVCPVMALSPDGWDHVACFAYRAEAAHCLEGCAPRLACPVGRTHHPGPDEMRHRQLAALR